MGVVVLNILMELFRWLGPVCICHFVRVIEIPAFSPVYFRSNIQAFARPI